MGYDGNMSHTLIFSLTEQKAQWELYQVHFIYLLKYYLFDCAGSSLRHVRSLIFVVAYGVFSCVWHVNLVEACGI